MRVVCEADEDREIAIVLAISLTLGIPFWTWVVITLF